MRIFHSPRSDPMLLDSRNGLAHLHAELQAFLSSPSVEYEARARQTGNPAPYDRFLPGLRVRKASGPIVLRLMSDGWLMLEGSTENLRRYVSHLYFSQEEGEGHHHPEHCDVPDYLAPSSMSLIIEADST